MPILIVYMIFAFCIMQSFMGIHNDTIKDAFIVCEADLFSLI